MEFPEKLNIDTDHDYQRLGQYLVNRVAPRDIFYVGNTELLRLIDEWKFPQAK